MRRAPKTGKDIADIAFAGERLLEPVGGRVVGHLEIERSGIGDLEAFCVDQPEIDKGAVVFLAHEVEHLAQEVGVGQPFERVFAGDDPDIAEAVLDERVDDEAVAFDHHRELVLDLVTVDLLELLEVDGAGDDEGREDDQRQSDRPPIGPDPRGVCGGRWCRMLSWQFGPLRSTAGWKQSSCQAGECVQPATCLRNSSIQWSLRGSRMMAQRRELSDILYSGVRILYNRRHRRPCLRILASRVGRETPSSRAAWDRLPSVWRSASAMVWRATRSVTVSRRFVLLFSQGPPEALGEDLVR